MPISLSTSPRVTEASELTWGRGDRDLVAVLSHLGTSSAGIGGPGGLPEQASSRATCHPRSWGWGGPPVGGSTLAWTQAVVDSLLSEPPELGAPTQRGGVLGSGPAVGVRVGHRGPNGEHGSWLGHSKGEASGMLVTF